MTDCLFCSIARHAAPASIRYEDDRIVAFDDLHPAAPVHILLVPKKHFASVADASREDAPLLGELIWQAAALARTLGLADDGFRLVFNTRNHAGQIIDHVHLHLIGGKPLGRMSA